MKKFFVILMGILFIGFLSNAQGPVMPYNNDIYSVAEVKAFALKTPAFAKFILSRCQEGLEANGYKTVLASENLPWLFDSCISIKEVTLKKGTFYNSYWDRSKKDLHFFLSDMDYEGMVGHFDYGRCHMTLWKGNCVNGLKVPLQVTKVATPPVIVDKPAPPPVNVIKKDSVVITIIKKDSIITEPKKVTPEDDNEVEEEKVGGTTTINNYTTNIYPSQPEKVYRGGYRREFRSSGFQIFAGYHGGGFSTPVAPTRRVTMGQPVGNTRRVTMGRPVGNNRRINMGQGTGG